MEGEKPGHQEVDWGENQNCRFLGLKRDLKQLPRFVIDVQRGKRASYVQNTIHTDRGKQAHGRRWKKRVRHRRG